MAVTINMMIDELTQYCDADSNCDCNNCKLRAKFNKEVDELTDTLGCDWKELGDYYVRKCYDWLKEIQNETPTNDVVNHPNHYTQGGIECIDALKAIYDYFQDGTKIIVNKSNKTIDISIVM